MYEVCWEFEESWNSGNCPPPLAWIERNKDLPADLLLKELEETERELEAKVAREAVRPVQVDDERYEFIEEIARGGAAVVWRVRDRHLQRETAVKYLLDNSDNIEMRSRLEREARLCARLVHPGIVPIHELCHFADGRPFVSMKLVEGKTLLQLVDSQPRPSIKSLVEIFSKACQAVAHAHRKGIIHRDLKPGNIMVGAFGEVQIMDWGLAKELPARRSEKAVSEAHTDTIRSIYAPLPSLPKCDSNAQEAVSNDLEATIVGTVCGTIAYMSPEQASGYIDSVDERSDVFALGAVLCRLLVAVPPYHDGDRSLMLEKAQRGEMKAALDALARSPHRKLAGLATRCMSVDQRRRPQDASEVVVELNKIQLAELRQRQALRVLVTAALVVLIAGAIFFYPRGGSPSESQSANSSLPAIQESTTDAEVLKAMFLAKSDDLALKSYEAALKANPYDERLHYLVAYALLSKRRLAECERVATRLIQINSQQPEYPFILSGALWGQGKFKESYAAIMQCRKLRDSGKRCDWPIEEKLSNLDVALDISANFEDLRVMDYPQADTKQLLLISEICEICNQFELALGFQDAGLSRAGEDWQRSVKVHHFLAYFLDRLLRRDDLSNDICNKALEKSLKWLNWQIEYASDEPADGLHIAERKELIRILKSARDLEVLFGATNDSRIAPELHEQLKEALARIEKLPSP